MNKKILSIALGSALSLAAVQHTQASDMYFSAGYEAQVWDLELPDDYAVGYLTAKGGFKITDGIYIEGKLGAGVSDDSNNYLDPWGDVVGITLDPKFMAGVYSVFQKEVNDNFNFYGKIGLNYLSVDLELEDYDYPEFSEKESISETKVALGAGLNYYFNQNHGLNFEISVPSIGDIGDLAGVTFGYTFRM